MTFNFAYEVRPKSKCTDIPMYDLRTQLAYRRVGNELGCMHILVEIESVESVMSHCCLCTVTFNNLCSVCNAAVELFTKNFCLQDRQLITPSTKMSWNNFKNSYSESKKTLLVIGCCTTILCPLTQNFCQRKTFRPFHILPTAQI
jgi:hypothetical protein